MKRLDDDEVFEWWPLATTPILAAWVALEGDQDPETDDVTYGDEHCALLFADGTVMAPERTNELTVEQIREILAFWDKRTP